MIVPISRANPSLFIGSSENNMVGSSSMLPLKADGNPLPPSQGVTRSAGIVHLPPHIRIFVAKTALFVAKNGREFERRIISNNVGNPKFNFLNVSSDPYHAYYQSVLSAFRTQFQHSQSVEADMIAALSINVNVDDKKKVERPQVRTPTGVLVSPFTGELVSVNEMAEHMRSSLMDPKYKKLNKITMARLSPYHQQVLPRISKKFDRLPQFQQRLNERLNHLRVVHERLKKRPDIQIPTRLVGNEVAERNKRLAEYSKRLAERNKILAERNKRLAEYSKRLAEYSKRMAEHNKRMKEDFHRFQQFHERFTRDYREIQPLATSSAEIE